jgi:hypothetical protein
MPLLDSDNMSVSTGSISHPNITTYSDLVSVIAGLHCLIVVAVSRNLNIWNWGPLLYTFERKVYARSCHVASTLGEKEDER